MHLPEKAHSSSSPMLRHMCTIITGQDTTWIIYRKQGLKTGEPCMGTVNKLHEWRQTTRIQAARLHLNYGQAAILSDDS